MVVDRKAVIREFKERKPVRGIYALRCTATNRVWVGATPNLGAAENAQLFTLRHASHRNLALQADWDAHGESAFSYEVLETLDDDTAPMLVHDLLKRKLQEWADRLSAPTLLR